MTATRWAPLVRKEVRALLPLWAGALAIVLIAGRVDAGARLGLFGYAFACAALGALSMGHEFSHRTLGLLLVQPVARRRLLVVKLGVLAVLVVTLGSFAASLLQAAGGPAPMLAHHGAAISWIGPMLMAVTLAPMLTLLTRSPLFGFILSAATPAAIVLGAEILVGLRFGFLDRLPPGAGEFREAVVIVGFLSVCAAAVPAVWWTFRRLEVVEGPAKAIDIGGLRLRPRHASSGTATAGPRRPILQLVGKELRLQHAVLVVSALYATGATALFALVRDPRWAEVLGSLTMVQAVLVSIMSGALASAEERQMGMIEAQMLVPVPVARQWAIKCGTALAVTLLLAIGLPYVASLLEPHADLYVDFGGLFRLETIAGLLGVTCVALYVSSLTTGGLRALVACSVAAGVAAILAVTSMLIALPLATAIAGALALLFPTVASRPTPDQLHLLRTAISTMALTSGAVMAALFLRFALDNHRSADRSPRRVVRHVLWLTAAATIMVAVFSGAYRFHAEATTRAAIEQRQRKLGWNDFRSRDRRERAVGSIAPAGRRRAEPEVRRPPGR